MLLAPHGQYVPAVEVTRGSMIESVHCAAIAVADSTGRQIARLGGIDHEVFLRSSAKPLQAMAVIESGAAAKFGFTPRELAVMTGSHSSEPGHIETVSGILDKIGLDVSALQCGTHTPFSREVAAEYRLKGRPLTALEHNCSGKHAGMLASALAEGHDPSNCLDPKHPVQQRILGILADLTGRMRDKIMLAIDGCSAPTFGVTLSEAARAFARLVSPESLPAHHRDAAARVVAAMRAHPEMVGGKGTLDTEVTAHPRHSLICKRGAEGVQCAAFTKDGAGYGIAAKVGDGDSGRARVALVTGILRQLDLLSDVEVGSLTEVSICVVRNNRGREIGVVRPAFTLQRT
jgi:L-asparaginase II